MQILEVQLARSVWLVDIRRLNPKGIASGPIHRGLIEKYRFLNPPQLGPEHFDGSKLAVYGSGEFRFNDEVVSVSLTVGNDGIMADSITSTDVADAFVADLSEWLSTAFSFNKITEIVTSPVYDSQLTFTSDVELLHISKSVAEFSDVLREYTGKQTVEPWALLFEPDGQRTCFSFERRVNTPFAKKEYFSTAALSTGRHLELIKHFERIFS